MKKANHPNIVLIVLDAVRQDHLSCYGYGRHTTPHIDRIAQEGVRFVNAYATSCWTIPTHASLFTGLYPSQHRADFDTQHLDSDHYTLAAFLGQRGYRTACISCNSFVGGGFTNLNHGFDLSIDVEGGPVGNGRLGQLWRRVHKRWHRLTRQDRGAARATQLALDWINSQPQPFFLFMNYMECHLPYRLKRPSRYQFVAPGDRQRVDNVPLDPFAVMAGQRSLTLQDIDDLKALYDGCLFELDQQVGRIDAHLHKLGLADNTIFIITSDHGESFGEHGLFDHQYGLYENLLRVPLIMRLPSGARAGQAPTQFVQHVDLLPTLAQQIDAAAVADLTHAGGDILGDGGRTAVFAEYLVPNLRAIQRRFPQANTSHLNVGLRAIRAGEYKLICRHNGHAALYHLPQDPGETTDVAADHPQVVAELQALLQQQLDTWPQLAGTTAAPATDELRQRLEALGYL